MVYIIIPVAILVITYILMYLYAGPFKGMPVLVYHKISSTKKADYYTVATSQMRQQLEYITQKGYNTIFLSDMVDYVEKGKPLPKKPLIIALEDGFRDNYTDMYPLLKEFNCKANVFIVAGFVQTPDNLGPRAEGEFMTIDEVKEIGKEHVQFGLHTMYHKNLHELTLAEIDEDTRVSKQRLDDLGIPYQPVFAYPYAYYFKDNLVKQAEVFGILKKHGVRYAFKVGDRLNRLPLNLSNRFMLNRLHVSGTYSMWQFKVTLMGFIRVTQRLKKTFQ